MNSSIWGTILCKRGSMEGEMESYERKKCKHGSKKWNKEQCYSPDTVICLRDMDMEFCTAVTNKSSGNELHAGCMWCVKVG